MISRQSRIDLWSIWYAERISTESRWHTVIVAHKSSETARYFYFASRILGIHDQVLLKVYTEVWVLCYSPVRCSTKDLKDVLWFFAFHILSRSTFCCFFSFILSLVSFLLSFHLLLIPLYALLDILCVHSANVVDCKDIASVLARVRYGSQNSLNWVQRLLIDICVEKEVLLSVAHSMTSKVCEQKHVLTLLCVCFDSLRESLHLLMNLFSSAINEFDDAIWFNLHQWHDGSDVEEVILRLRYVLAIGVNLA